ncbi:MAG TPA: hypothetical protein VNK96_05220 [Fimbriimonadales bacterium]|nr:hypothetical protein [Fimbriimonadales bacterium]
MNINEPVLTPYGICCRVQADAGRILAGLKWIVRGLYFRHQKKILNPNLDYKWWGYNLEENEKVCNNTWYTPGYNGPFFVGGITLAYRVMILSEVPDFSDWQLVFYNRLLFMIRVNEEGLIRKAFSYNISSTPLI